MGIFFRTHWRTVVVALLVCANGVFVALLVRDDVNHAVQQRSYERALSELATTGSGFDEIGKFFVRTAEEEGAVYAFEVLKRATLPPNIDLHLVGHLIGDELYKQQGIAGMRFCTHDFRNACSHTVVIGALLEHGTSVLDDIHGVCRQAPGGKGAYTMCFHGFGHGVLAYTGYDVPEAVALCSRTGTEAHQYREYSECVGGIIMEMVSGIHDRDLWAEKRVEYMSADDPLKLCTHPVFTDDVRGMCYVYITPEMFLAAGADLASPDPATYPRAFSYCDRLPEAAVGDRDACFGGFGKEFVVLVQDRDIRKINETPVERLALIDTWCAAAGDEDGQASCLSHALNSLYWGGENDPAVSIRFCAVLADEHHRTACIEQLIRNASFFVEDATAREQFCAALPVAFTSQCRDRLQ